jgi:hypothetical protein
VVNSNEALKPARDTFLVKAPDAYAKQAPLPKLEAGKTQIGGLTYKGGDPRDKSNWVR